MGLTETMLVALFGGLISAFFILLMGYITFRGKLESRINDLEHEIKSLEPLKDLLHRVGLERIEKVLKGDNK